MSHKINGSPSRLSFQQDEKRQSWLPLILDAYAVIDEGVSRAIADEEKKRGIRLACARGCGNCCTTHRDIPVYPLELVGIYWYVIEKIPQPQRGILKKNLNVYHKGGPCPFLIEGVCSIHPMRPIACRQFNVFNKPCDEGEDPYYTRRADVLSPYTEFRDKAFSIMLPFYGITGKQEIERAVQSRMVDNLVRVLQRCNWYELAVRMDEFDFGKSKELRSK